MRLENLDNIRITDHAMTRFGQWVGMKMSPTFHCQLMSAMKIARTPPRTRPPGQPAWRMLSHFVLSLRNIVATTGLMNASTVPFPSPRMIEPQ